MIAVTVTKRTATRVTYSYELGGRSFRTTALPSKLDGWVAAGGAVIVADVA